MFHIGAFKIELMGQTATFDVVTAYGLVCAAVFLTGFIVAMRKGKKGQRTSG